MLPPAGPELTLSAHLIEAYLAADEVTDVMFAVHMMYVEPLIGIVAIFWLVAFALVLAWQQFSSGRGAWAVLRACTSTELGYR